MEELRQVPDGDVQQQCAALQAAAQADQGVEGEGGHVGLPPLPPVRLQVLLILDPPGEEQGEKEFDFELLEVSTLGQLCVNHCRRTIHHH